MYKVVIIDDEPIIVEGLSRSIQWESWDCSVVGTAESGLSGKDIIQKLRPDIIFTDISMPGMDGLSMIAAIKSQFPTTQIAILTGYRDFEYAQQAIRLGVTRFLLKPSKMDEIEEALSVMCSKLGEDCERHNNEVNEKEEKDKKDKEAIENMEVPLESHASSFIVKNALRYIEENYKEKIKLADVADNTYVSQWHLSKLLNSHTGQSFSEILNGIRMEKAKELLKDPSMRIGDVADQIGRASCRERVYVLAWTAGVARA